MSALTHALGWIQRIRKLATRATLTSACLKVADEMKSDDSSAQESGRILD